MSGLFGGGKNTVTEQPKIAGIQLQTSTYGQGVPIIYGTCRAVGNLIWYDDFTSIQHSETRRVGKGGGSSQTSVSYTYTAAVILALCEGPIVGIGQMWRDKDLSSVIKQGMTIGLGARGQTPWTYLTTNHPTAELGYSGTAYAAHAAFDLGNGGTLKNNSFEINGFLGTRYGGTIEGMDIMDANPGDIITDLLTNSFYGAGLATGKVADLLTGLANYGVYCSAMDFWMSIAIDSSKPAIDWLRQILQATNSEAVWSQGTGGMTLKVRPYGDAVIGAYDPDLTIQYALTDDDFLIDGSEDPVQVERLSPADAFNSIPVTYFDRGRNYISTTTTYAIQPDIDAFGLRQGDTADIGCVLDYRRAHLISGLLAQRVVHTKNKYTFRVGWKYILLEPMDFITIESAQTGIAARRARVESIEENDNGDLTIVAREWPLGTGHIEAITPESGTAGTGNGDPNAAPGDANEPVIFAAPVLYQDGIVPQAVIGASGADMDVWGGCEVWVSYDDTTYAFAGRITAPARHGVTTAVFASGSAHDTVNTLSVDLSVSLGELDSVNADTAEDGLSLCWVEDSEFISYQTAALTSAYNYDLTTLERGITGTTKASHATGKKFMRLDSAPIKIDIPSNRVGQTIYVKLPSFNNFGNALQDISTLTPYTFVYGTPVPQYVFDVSGFTGNEAVGSTVQLTWDALTATNLDVYVIREGGTDWDTASPLAELKATTYTTTARSIGAHTFRIKARDTSGNYSLNAASVTVTVTGTTPSLFSIPFFTATPAESDVPITSRFHFYLVPFHLASGVEQDFEIIWVSYSPYLPFFDSTGTEIGLELV